MADIGSSPLGYNQFAYCFNNPINLIDTSGTWPTGINVASFLRSPLRRGAEILLCNIFEDAVVYNQEFAEHIEYMIFYTHSTGVGYNNNFNTGKNINGYIIVDTLGVIGIGVDVNFGGYGGSIQVGKETSVSVHANSITHEVGLTNLGRLYYQNTYITESGGYAYSRVSLNGPEIASAAIATYYIGTSALPAFIPGVSYALTK